MIIGDGFLAAGTVPYVIIGVLFWGSHMAMTQGVFAALVADTAPAGTRGTAFGLFSLASGLSMLAACLFAGWLWDRYNPAVPFLAGAVFAVFTFAGLVVLRRVFHIEQAPHS